MKTYIFLANGFEILETFSPVDVLKRCGAEVITVSTEKNLFVSSSQNNIVKADVMLNEIDYKDADLVVIPGGYPGYINLRENKDVVDIVKYFLENDKYVASICGGPTIFSHNKIANGAKITAHSSVRKEIEENRFPGYVLVEMVMTDEAWFVVRNTPNVTGFVGSHGN
ncbi:MAG: DJ-1/PfpI family protein, partial [Fusobacterium periodonticum]|nr:DJ-1/PfpI family protein [Fusobacterium periodonticum]